MIVVLALLTVSVAGSLLLSKASKKTMLPNVDWSREWTDKQILKEISYED